MRYAKEFGYFPVEDGEHCKFIKVECDQINFCQGQHDVLHLAGGPTRMQKYRSDRCESGSKFRCQSGNKEECLILGNLGRKGSDKDIKISHLVTDAINRIGEIRRFEAVRGGEQTLQMHLRYLVSSFYFFLSYSAQIEPIIP